MCFISAGVSDQSDSQHLGIVHPIAEGAAGPEDPQDPVPLQRHQGETRTLGDGREDLFNEVWGPFLAQLLDM